MSQSFGGSGSVSLVLASDCSPAASMGYCTSGWGTCLDSASCLVADAGAAPSLSWSNTTGGDQTVGLLVDGHTANYGAYELDFAW